MPVATWRQLMMNDAYVIFSESSPFGACPDFTSGGQLAKNDY